MNKLFLFSVLFVVAQALECSNEPTLNDPPTVVPPLDQLWKATGPMCTGANPWDVYFEVLNTDCELMQQVRVDVWQASHDGSDECHRTMFTDEKGRASVRTVKPAQVGSSPAHFNVRVTVGGYKPLTTQVYFNTEQPEDALTNCVTESCKDASLRMDILPLNEGVSFGTIKLVLQNLHNGEIGLGDIDLDNYGDADADDLDADDSDDGDDDDDGFHFFHHIGKMWHHHKKLFLGFLVVLAAMCCVITWSYYYYSKAQRQIKMAEARISLLEREVRSHQPAPMLPIALPLKQAAALPPQAAPKPSFPTFGRK